MSSSVGMMTFPIYGKMKKYKNVPTHQPERQLTNFQSFWVHKIEHIAIWTNGICVFFLSTLAAKLGQAKKQGFKIAQGASPITQQRTQVLLKSPSQQICCEPLPN